MYPLLLKAPVKDYLWGGTRLKEEFGFETKSEIAAEAWVLSCHKEGNSTVVNGPLSGKTLTEALEVLGKDALGIKAERFEYFPILIKLIDAKDSLSVQVHPNDAYALKNEGEYGKTEMWYVVDCEEGAQLIYGFNKKISKSEFASRIKDNTLTNVFNIVTVKKGDVFFISAGTLHAIGKGILIAEVQQNSNTTYRVSDYGRLGPDGKPRELHITKALDVIKTEPPTFSYGQVGNLQEYPFGTVRELAQCEQFTTELLYLDGEDEIYEKDSFVSLVILEGNIILSYADGTLCANKGDSIFIPANLRVIATGTAEILCTHI